MDPLGVPLEDGVSWVLCLALLLLDDFVPRSGIGTWFIFFQRVCTAEEDDVETLW